LEVDNHMSWTYTKDPENVPRDAVRRLCGDANPNNPKLEDSEIGYFLSENDDDPIAAAADAAAAIAANYADQAAEKTGDLAQSLAQKSKNYLMVAQDLRSRIKTSEEDTGAAEPWCGAVNREPLFYRGIGYRARDTTDYSR
jgi:hypothetical protein